MSTELSHPNREIINKAQKIIDNHFKSLGA